MTDATRAQILAKCTALDAEVRDLRSQRDEFRSANHVKQKEVEETRKQFADLKERLYNAEMENQRLRGYLQRVQEDDVVREDLVETGDPDGQRAMVPKRKSTMFQRPDEFSRPDSVGLTAYAGFNSDRQKPKHWIAY